jgi:hypothetical protein
VTFCDRYKQLRGKLDRDSYFYGFLAELSQRTSHGFLRTLQVINTSSGALLPTNLNVAFWRDPFSEQADLQFRPEAYEAFNRSDFISPIDNFTVLTRAEPPAP